MSLKLGSLLNPAPPSPQTYGEPQDSPKQERISSNYGYGQQHSDRTQHYRRPSYEPQNAFAHTVGDSPEFRRPSLRPTYSYTATPVEPTPRFHRERQPSGSSLAQYHHASRSSEEQRRASVAWDPQYEHQLAPMKSDYFTVDRDTQMHEEPQSLDESGVVKAEEDQIKYEVQSHLLEAATSYDLPPEVADGLDAETLRAISKAKKEYGTRDRKATKRESPAQVEEMAKPAPKKRPHPAKKGTASAVNKKEPQHPAKKRKVESTAQQRRVTATPSSAPRKIISATPGASPAPGQRSGISLSTAVAAYADEQYSEDEYSNGVYCICRKPDNHTWMIACDGGCDDWFHGSCVNIEEQDDGLIDKYICPNCEAKGQGHTTWKPMCRDGGCRRPAWVNEKLVSKYCSDECGRELFSRNTQ